MTNQCSEGRIQSTSLSQAIEALNACDRNTLAVTSAGGVCRTYTQRGVADLYLLLKEQAELLHEASVADKIVGKAAAAIMISAGVAELHSRIVSELALSILNGSGIKVSYESVTPHVINRSGSGWCPLESACRDCSNVEECLIEIDNFFQK